MHFNWRKLMHKFMEIQLIAAIAGLFRGGPDISEINVPPLPEAHSMPHSNRGKDRHSGGGNRMSQRQIRQRQRWV